MKFKQNKSLPKQKSKQIKQSNNNSHKNQKKLASYTQSFAENIQDQQHQQGYEHQQQQITWKHKNDQNSNQQDQHSEINEQNNQNNLQEEDHEQQQIPAQNQQEDEQNQQINPEDNVLVENERNLEQYQQQIGNRGVIYMSRIPPYMTPNYIRKLLSIYNIQRIYLLPESQWARKNRIKKGGSKRICFREGWIQFTNKKDAKMAALTLNGQKMVHKKGSFYSQDVWNLKYLAKFKWHHLTQKLAHEERLKKEKLRMEMDQQRKVYQYYSSQVNKSKVITGMIKNKIQKGKQLKERNIRLYGQKSTLQENKD